MIPDKKNQMVKLLTNHIPIPENLKQSMLSGDDECENRVMKIIDKQIKDLFGKK